MRLQRNNRHPCIKQGAQHLGLKRGRVRAEHDLAGGDAHARPKLRQPRLHVGRERGDFQHRRTARHTQGRDVDLGGQATIIQNAHHVTKLVDLVEIVRRQENRMVTAGQLTQQIEHFALASWIEAAGRLVDQQHVGVRQQRLRNPKALEHAFRIGCQHPIGNIL